MTNEPNAENFDGLTSEAIDQLGPPTPATRAEFDRVMTSLEPFAVGTRTRAVETVIFDEQHRLQVSVSNYEGRSGGVSALFDLKLYDESGERLAEFSSGNGVSSENPDTVVPIITKAVEIREISGSNQAPESFDQRLVALAEASRFGLDEINDGKLQRLNSSLHEVAEELQRSSDPEP